MLKYRCERGAYMKLALSNDISKIDKYATDVCGIPMYDLIDRSGEAVAAAALSLCADGQFTVLAGPGNNGADGYAAARHLAARGKRVRIVDILGRAQCSDGGKEHLAAAIREGIEIIKAPDNGELSRLVCEGVIIDAIVGTGVRLPLRDTLVEVCGIISESPALKLAVDVPLGIDPDSGETYAKAPYYDMTVELSLAKVGVMSYPARAHAGKIVFADIFRGQTDQYEVARSDNYYFDEVEAARILPKRSPRSNKGSFGKCSIVAGSEIYRGAPILALCAALRSGGGYTELISEEKIINQILPVYPEAIFKTRNSLDRLSDSDVRAMASSLMKSGAILIGPGCSVSEGHYKLLRELLMQEGAPIVIDADSINTLAERGEEGMSLLRGAARQVIITPHPLELSRLTSIPTEEIEASRLSVASWIAKDLGVILLLKGAATVVTDGKVTYINSSGSTALAKAGSGDVLAGLIAGLIASSSKGISEVDSARSCVELTALAAYLHGAAADALSAEYSEYGVTPSDLPLAISEVIKGIVG